MPILRVQATPKANNPAPAVELTFGVTPVIGHGIIVVINGYSGGVPTGCVDNRGGNNYTFVGQRSNGAGAGIFYCPAITATGSPFKVTVTAAANWTAAIAIETNVGLELDQFIGAIGNGITPATGPTASLTGVDSFQVASFASQTPQTSIAVQSGWLQEFEELTTSYVAGEADSKEVSNSAGQTASASWTCSAAGNWAAIIAAFKAVGGSGNGGRIQTLPAGGSHIMNQNQVYALPANKTTLTVPGNPTIEISNSPDFINKIAAPIVNNKVKGNGAFIRVTSGNIDVEISRC